MKEIRTVKKSLWFLLGVFSFVFYGCVSSTDSVSPSAATISPSAAIVVPSPTQSNPTAAPTLRPSPTPDSTPSVAESSRSLYFLSVDSASSERPRSVWRLDPGDTELERVTPPDLDITSFDLWLGDGRMAYGTGSGQLYVVMPEQEPRLLYDAGLHADGAFEINSLAWSPKGTRLAYSLRYADVNDRAPGQADGLWLVTLNDGEPIKLLNNRHLDPDQLDVNEVRSISDPIWSPDGTALLLTGHYWAYLFSVHRTIGCAHKTGHVSEFMT
jgi:hypothetical protein